MGCALSLPRSRMWAYRANWCLPQLKWDRHIDLMVVVAGSQIAVIQPNANFNHATIGRRGGIDVENIILVDQRPDLLDVPGKAIGKCLACDFGGHPNSQRPNICLVNFGGGEHRRS